MIPFLDNALKAIHKQYYDDLVDQLNYYYSTLILLFLAILVSAKQYVGNPINCWFPFEFTESWIRYAESYCFVSNTYYPYEGITNTFTRLQSRKMINYYQWVPIVLALQGLLFYLPNLIWQMLNWQSGINVKSILKMASEAEIADDEKRKKTLKTLAKYIEDCVGLQTALGGVNEFRRLFCFRCGRANPYLTCLYIFTKILYILNVVVQFMLLNSFFDINYAWWGFQVIRDVVQGKEWVDSGYFPRVTLCDFSVRALGQRQNFTVQCVLMINMFNEKIYLFLWVWLCFIGVCTSINFVYWMFTLVPSYCRYRFIHKYLRIGAEMTNSTDDRRLVEKFVSKALRSDGVLLMRFISGHTGDMLVTELMFRLFQEFIAKTKLQKNETDKLPMDFIQASTISDPATAIRNISFDDQNGFNETLYDVNNDHYPMVKYINEAAKPSNPKIREKMSPN